MIKIHAISIRNIQRIYYGSFSSFYDRLAANLHNIKESSFIPQKQQDVRPDTLHPAVFIFIKSTKYVRYLHFPIAVMYSYSKHSGYSFEPPPK